MTGIIFMKRTLSLSTRKSVLLFGGHYSYYKKDGVTKENIGKLLNDILEVKRKMTEDQVTEVHLFLACPVAFSAAVGAILDNWVPVKVYTLDRNTGTYEFWTVLHKGFIPGLRYKEVEEVVTEQVKPEI